VVAAVTGTASQAGSLALGEGSSAALTASQVGAVTVYNRLADFDTTTQVQTVVLAESSPDEARVSQLQAIVVYKARVYDPRIRAWTFTLDGHDFYVLRLGDTSTILYDTHAEQWYEWDNDNSTSIWKQDIWKANTGQNWIGASSLSGTYGSNIVCGDDVFGALYFLDTAGSRDDDPVIGSETQTSFERVVTGQIVKLDYEAQPCYEVQLLGAIGDNLDATLTDVTLETSDDSGNTYSDHGTLTLSAADYTARATWLSLGSIEAPGRLFRISDYGALQRIDSLYMKDNSK
jgi:hypothetical protein